MTAIQSPKPVAPEGQVLSPSQRLAKQVVDRLVAKKLLTDDLAGKVLPRLASGNMSQSDWKLVFERSLGMHKKT